MRVNRPEEARVPIVRVNGAQVFTDDTAAPADRPDAPTIVFGHGLLMSGRMFAACMPLGPRSASNSTFWFSVSSL